MDFCVRHLELHTAFVIIEVPTADEFHAAGLNLLHLAWGNALAPIFDMELVGDYAASGEVQIEEFWAVAQPNLANALSLIQQSMELALKARIAQVSPYLLLSRDPKSWPGGADTGPVPFSDFHTLDAADLVKVHNTVVAAPLGDDFRQFFDDVRRERNALMHSVPRRSYEASNLVRMLLRAVEYLYGPEPWTKQLLLHEIHTTKAYVGNTSEGAEYNAVMRQVDAAIRVLTTADARHFFGFDKRRRAYICPSCRGNADRHLTEDWEHLAQLRSKEKDETRLWCAVCRQEQGVERARCRMPDCRGNVVGAGSCLTCDWPQDRNYQY